MKLQNFKLVLGTKKYLLMFWKVKSIDMKDLQNYNKHCFYFYFLLKKMSFGKYSIRSKKANKYITIKDNRCVLYENDSSMQQIF